MLGGLPKSLADRDRPKRGMANRSQRAPLAAHKSILLVCSRICSHGACWRRPEQIAPCAKKGRGARADPPQGRNGDSAAPRRGSGCGYQIRPLAGAALAPCRIAGRAAATRSSHSGTGVRQWPPVCISPRSSRLAACFALSFITSCSHCRVAGAALAPASRMQRAWCGGAPRAILLCTHDRRRGDGEGGARARRPMAGTALAYLTSRARQSLSSHRMQGRGAAVPPGRILSRACRVAALVRHLSPCLSPPLSRGGCGLGPRFSHARSGARRRPHEFLSCSHYVVAARHRSPAPAAAGDDAKSAPTAPAFVADAVIHGPHACVRLAPGVCGRRVDRAAAPLASGAAGWWPARRDMGSGSKCAPRRLAPAPHAAIGAAHTTRPRWSAAGNQMPRCPRSASAACS